MPTRRATPPKDAHYDTFGTIIPSYGAGRTGDADCTMGFGSQSWGVVVLQITLNECYDQRITVDGLYRSQTQQAVANAQTWERVAFHRSVSTDGTYGPETRLAMHFFGEQTSSSGTNPIDICMRLDGTSDIR